MMTALPGYVAPTLRQTKTITMSPLYGGFSVHIPHREPLPGDPRPPAYDASTFPRFVGIMPHEPHTILLRVAIDVVPSLITVDETKGGFMGHALEGGECFWSGEVLVDQEGPVVVEAITAAIANSITLRVGRYQVCVEVAGRSEVIRRYEEWSEEHPYIDAGDEPEGYYDNHIPPTEHWWITFSRVKGVV